jgi:Aspartyl protease
LGTSLRDGLLDTGADDTVFPVDLAESLGIDLSKEPAHDVGLAGRGSVPCRYAKVALRITDGKETYSWEAVVGFMPIALRYVLLGHAGFLQFFDVDFRGADKDFQMWPNRDFPGKRKRNVIKRPKRRKD